MVIQGRGLKKQNGLVLGYFCVMAACAAATLAMGTR